MSDMLVAELLALPKDRFWMKRAACREGVDTEIFFPEEHDSTGAAQKAKAICANCPVRLQCLRASIEGNEEYGIWGGMSGRSRMKLRRKMGVGWGIGRPRTQTCIAGHPRTPENTYVSPTSGERRCKICRKRNQQKRRGSKLT